MSKVSTTFIFLLLLFASQGNGALFKEWKGETHRNAYQQLQATAQEWSAKDGIDQYIIYGDVNVQTPNSFNWQIFPVEKSESAVGRFWQQFLVLWKLTFQSLTPPTTNISILQPYHPSSSDEVGDDPFCDPQVIARQLVFGGEKVNVLYNYAPIGVGEDRLHFLIVPKAHRSTFGALTEEEFVEASILSQMLINHFSQTRTISKGYLFHKTGLDAGQTVPHWHMHVILISSQTQDFFGRINMLKNMLIGSTPMTDQQLKITVNKLKSELLEAFPGTS